MEENENGLENFIEEMLKGDVLNKINVDVKEKSSTYLATRSIDWRDFYIAHLKPLNFGMFARDFVLLDRESSYSRNGIKIRIQENASGKGYQPCTEGEFSKKVIENTLKGIGKTELNNCNDIVQFVNYVIKHY